MFPLLAMLVAVHVAMPIAERRWARGKVVESLDTVYLLALPVVAALTAQALAPSRACSRCSCGDMRHLARGGGVAVQPAARRHGLARHHRPADAGLRSGRALPRSALGTRRTRHRGDCAGVLGATLESTRLQGFLAGLVLVLAAIHMINALAPRPTAWCSWTSDSSSGSSARVDVHRRATLTACGRRSTVSCSRARSAGRRLPLVRRSCGSISYRRG